ncbi:MAG: hypothetical protein ACRCV3_03320 [Desulfovibrionaceae bacterium]
MDRVGANFYRCVNMMVERLSEKSVMLYFLVGEEDKFNAMGIMQQRILIKMLRGVFIL